MTNPDPELTALEARLAQGEEEALAALFDRHRERLWRIIHFRLDRRLQGRVDPDDILQEAYLAASRNRDHYGRAGGISAFLWLRMISQQALIDTYRRHLEAQRRDAGREIRIDDPGIAANTSASLVFQLVGNLTSPSGAAVRAEWVELVEEAIEGMDNTDREVLALRHFEELTNNEVAEVLQIRPKAASIRYVRALKKLRAVLARQPGFKDEQPGLEEEKGDEPDRPGS